MNILTLGSCRITLKSEFETKNNFQTFQGGTVYTTNEMVQAFKIMNNELKVPDDMKKYFRQEKLDKWNSNVDLENIDVFCLEVCTKTNFIKNDFFVDKNFGETMQIETHQDIQENLNTILTYTKKRMLVISHNNIKHSRQQLIDSVHSWCKEKGVKFFNPTELILSTGISKCFMPANEKMKKTLLLKVKTVRSMIVIIILFILDNC